MINPVLINHIFIICHNGKKYKPNHKILYVLRRFNHIIIWNLGRVTLEIKKPGFYITSRIQAFGE